MKAIPPPARRVNGPGALPPISAQDAAAEPPEARVFPPSEERDLPAGLPDATKPPAADEAPDTASAWRPPTLATIHPALCKPFSIGLVEIKPGATTKDRTRALAMAYVDARAYQGRLDRVAGPEGWAVEYRPIGERAILCRLTILGIAREDVGECDAGDPNQATSAAMQAFKRACAAFGMGRYLYSLPKPWVDYDEARKQIKDAAGAARQIYEAAGLPIK